MEWTILLNGLLIVLARVTDQTVGTIRTVMVVNGRRGAAFGLGFIEVFVWILVVSQIIQRMAQASGAEYVFYAVAYALGFAAGNWLGIVIEGRLAIGDQVLRIFTRIGGDMAAILRREGWTVTELTGRGRDGPVSLLFIELPRKRAIEVARRAIGIDPAAYFVIDDVRTASSASLRSVADAGPQRTRSLMGRLGLAER